MSRGGLRPAPSEAALRSTPLHVVVRDWPETLVPLREAGVDPAAAGGAPLASLDGADALVAACVAATAWRGQAP